MYEKSIYILNATFMWHKTEEEGFVPVGEYKLILRSLYFRVTCNEQGRLSVAVDVFACRPMDGPLWSLMVY